MDVYVLKNNNMKNLQIEELDYYDIKYKII